MFSTLRNRFGIPGVISVVALVFAMLGGAYAASDGGNDKGATASAKKSAKGPRGPRGPKGATGATGAAGAQGAPGPAGANGKDGANGSNGADGKNGESVKLAAAGAECPEGGTKLTVGAESKAVCNGTEGEAGAKGEPWTAGGTLPPGATETGAFSTAGGSEFSWLALPFSIPLSGPLDEEHVHIVRTNGMEVFNLFEERTPINCLGSVTAPKANEGHLCVYIGYAESIAGSFITPPSNPPGPAQGADVSGAILSSGGTSASAKISGTFAVKGF